MQDKKYIVILSTAGSMEEAERIADKLVGDRLVACVNILSGVRSVYRWRNAIQKDQEVLMIMKTLTENFDRVERTIRELHSYEVPEVICVSLENGFEGYLHWIDDSLRS